MAGSASITRRKTKSGLRYAVRYRRGGRLFPGLHGGSFKTQREARERRDLILGELAAGRDPAAKLRAAPTVRVTLAQWSERFVASRVDLAPSTVLNAEVALKQILPTFGDRDPSAITWQDVQSWIGSLALKPSSVSQYLVTFRAVLDFAEIEPNPARDRRVKLPRQQKVEIVVPTRRRRRRLLAAVPLAVPACRWRVLEQTGMRVGELSQLTWGDVDEASSRFLVRKGKTASPAAG